LFCFERYRVEEGVREALDRARARVRREREHAREKIHRVDRRLW